MSIILSLVLASAGAANSIEVVRTDESRLVALTNVWAEYGRTRFAIQDVDNDTFDWYLDTHSPWRRIFDGEELVDPNRVAGSWVWGLSGNTFYMGWHNRWDGNSSYPVSPAYPPTPLGLRAADISVTSVGTVALGFDGVIDELNSEGEAQEEASFRARVYAREHNCYCKALIEYIVENAGSLAKDWNLYYDLLYTSEEDFKAVAARDGQLIWWTTSDFGTVEGEWTSHDWVDTTIDGPFRVHRAGAGLANEYIIDEQGRIHTMPGPDMIHRHIGNIQNYDAAHDDTLTLLFEDQMTEKIGILHAATDDTITVLEIDWLEEGFADDFHATLDDADELREHLNTLANLLRADRGR